MDKILSNQYICGLVLRCYDIGCFIHTADECSTAANCVDNARLVYINFPDGFDFNSVHLVSLAMEL